VPTESNLVSWQSVYFALAALSFNTLTQPCGRVCGQNTKIRTYVRSSPFFCAFDLLSLFIRLLVYTIGGITPIRAVLATVAARFDADDEEGEEEGKLQSLLKNVVVRWIVFIPTLLQAIKLFALGGVRVSQAWGAVLLGAFVVVEGLGYLGSLCERIEVSQRSCLPRWLASPSARMEENMTNRIQQMKEPLETVDYTCYILAMISHLLLPAWVFWQVVLMPTPDYPINFTQIPLLLGGLLSTLWIMGSAGGISLLLDERFHRKKVYRWMVIISYCVLAFVGYLKAVLVIYSTARGTGYAISICVAILVTSFLLLLLSIPVLSINESRVLRKQVLFLEGQYSAGVVEAEVMQMVLALMVFIVTILSSVLWYALKYDSADTFKPNWTNKFG
jgi:hypothetical protein